MLKCMWIFDKHGKTGAYPLAPEGRINRHSLYWVRNGVIFKRRPRHLESLSLHAAIQRLPGQFMSKVIDHRKNYTVKGSTSQKAAIGRERDKDTRDKEEKQHSNEERHQKVKHGCILKRQILFRGGRKPH